LEKSFWLNQLNESLLLAGLVILRDGVPGHATTARNDNNLDEARRNQIGWNERCHRRARQCTNPRWSSRKNCSIITSLAGATQFRNAFRAAKIDGSQYSRHVPRKILLWWNVPLITSPFGTPPGLRIGAGLVIIGGLKGSGETKSANERA